uniref:Uncharacterized protein n=1 Tax=Labrus bergylta TaxID=56723 RepID=A0A3Q3F0C3_9LABR
MCVCVVFYDLSVKSCHAGRVDDANLCSSRCLPQLIGGFLFYYLYFYRCNGIKCNSNEGFQYKTHNMHDISKHPSPPTNTTPTHDYMVVIF